MKIVVEKTTINLDNDKYFIDLVKNNIIKVYKDGRVKNIKTGNFLGNVNNGGYYVIGHKVKGTKKTKHILIHRLVYIVFKNNMEPAPFIINHKDGVKSNNRSSNLERSTYSENNKHAFKIGLSKVNIEVVQKLRNSNGEKANGSKLTNKQADEIRKLYNTRNFSQRELGKKFGVNHCTINHIVNNKSYVDRPKFYFAPSLVKQRRLDREKYS